MKFNWYLYTYVCSVTIGRTGAGKSTLSLAFFRFMEPSKGSITIDGINISQIGLKDLRSSLTIIPQEPVLFSGTIRSNLDPTGSSTDDQLWKALNAVKLRESMRQQFSEAYSSKSQ